MNRSIISNQYIRLQFNGGLASRFQVKMGRNWVDVAEPGRALVFCLPWAGGVPRPMVLHEEEFYPPLASSRRMNGKLYFAGKKVNHLVRKRSISLRYVEEPESLKGLERVVFFCGGKPSPYFSWYDANVVLTLNDNEILVRSTVKNIGTRFLPVVMGVNANLINPFGDSELPWFNFRADSYFNCDERGVRVSGPFKINPQASGEIEGKIRRFSKTDGPLLSYFLGSSAAAVYEHGQRMLSVKIRSCCQRNEVVPETCIQSEFKPNKGSLGLGLFSSAPNSLGKFNLDEEVPGLFVLDSGEVAEFQTSIVVTGRGF